MPQCANANAPSIPLPNINPDYVASAKIRCRDRAAMFESLQRTLQRMQQFEPFRCVLHVIMRKWLHYIFQACVSTWKRNHSKIMCDVEAMANQFALMKY